MKNGWIWYKNSSTCVFSREICSSDVISAVARAW